MKYVVVLGDGMADEPIGELGGKTPLQAARTPVMDAMAKVSEQGIAYTVPENLRPEVTWQTLLCLAMTRRSIIPEDHRWRRFPSESI